MSRSRSVAFRPLTPVAVFIAMAATFGVSGHLWSCGPGEDQGSFSLKIDRALVLEAVAVDVFVYDEARSCQSIRAEWPRPAPVRGPVRRDIGETERTNGLTIRLDPIAEGTYVVFVDAVDSLDNSLGSGCAPAQVVSSRQLSRSRVIIGG